MKSRERKYLQSKKFEKALDNAIKYAYPTAGSYDGIKMKRFWHDEFTLWDTGQPISINPKKYFDTLMKPKSKL